MWVHTDVGFVSIVQDEDDDQLMRVRARSKADLTAFLALRPDSSLDSETMADVMAHLEAVEMYATFRADYPWKAKVAREAVMVLVAEHVRQIDYGNFKGRVAEQIGAQRAKTLGGVWAKLMDIEREPDADVPRRR